MVSDVPRKLVKMIFFAVITGLLNLQAYTRVLNTCTAEVVVGYALICPTEYLGSFDAFKYLFSNQGFVRIYRAGYSLLENRLRPCSAVIETSG